MKNPSSARCRGLATRQILRAGTARGDHADAHAAGGVATEFRRKFRPISGLSGVVSLSCAAWIACSAFGRACGLRRQAHPRLADRVDSCRADPAALRHAASSTGLSLYRDLVPCSHRSPGIYRPFGDERDAKARQIYTARALPATGRPCARSCWLARSCVLDQRRPHCSPVGRLGCRLRTLTGSSCAAPVDIRGVRNKDKQSFEWPSFKR
jgi:hypothetical protein